MIEYTWEGFWDVSIIFHKPEIEKEKQSPFMFFLPVHTYLRDSLRVREEVK